MTTGLTTTRPSTDAAMSSPHTIRWWLLWPALATLLPAVVAMAWAVGSAYTTEQQTRERGLRDLGALLSLAVDRELQQRAAVAHVLSLSSDLDEGAATTPQALGAFAQDVHRATIGEPGWIELRSADATLLSTRALLPETTAPPSSVAVMTAMSLSASTAAPPSASTPLFNRLTVTGLMRAPHDGRLRAMVHVPVVRRGVTVLNLGVAIVPQTLQAIFDRQRVDIEASAVLFDGDRAVVARFPGEPAPMGQTQAASWRQPFEGPDGTVLRTAGPRGEPMLRHVQHLRDGWSLVAETQQPQWARLPGAVGQVALGTGLLLLLAAVGAWWVARRIVGAMDQLRHAAERMQQGQSVEALTTGVRECDQVGLALVDAAAAMRDTRINLQRRVDAAVQSTRRAEQILAGNQRVEALGRLTSGVAHDFNNLLGVVSNSAYLIQRRAPDVPAVQSAVDATLRAVQNGSRLTTQLLRFVGRQRLRAQPIELGAFFADATTLLRTVLGGRITLQVCVADDTPALVADPGELELALTNLAFHARASMPQAGTVQIEVGGCHEDGDAVADAAMTGAAWVQIVVRDTGKGYRDDELAHLFEPTFADQAQGGLMLSQVRGFCVQSGGRVAARSEPGVGTSISMILPAGGGHADTLPQARPSPAAASGIDDAHDLRGLRVLLVEDDAEVASVTDALLQTLGMTVTRAHHALHAMRVLAEHDVRFDIVLSDVAMQGEMDGLALARTLRWRWPGLPIVLISGFTAATIDSREFDVLPKPCMLTMLTQSMHRALASAKHAA